MMNRYLNPTLLPAKQMALVFCLVLLCLGSISTAANAEDIICNTDDRFQCDGPVCTGEEDGFLSILTAEIRAVLDNAWQEMYTNILIPFTDIGAAVITLYIMIGGIMFALGILNMSLGEISKRVIKLVAIGIFLQSVAAFNTYIAPFFRDGVDEIILAMTQTMAAFIDPGGDYVIATLNTPNVGPFTALDMLMARLLAGPTIMVFEGGINANPSYGTAASIIFGLGMVFVFAMIARALWVYLIYLLATTLLFGLAPIFLTFMLFERTKNLFNGWLGQLVNFSLQPVMMFSFIGFFSVMMMHSLTDLLEQQVCFGAIERGVSGSSVESRGALPAYDTDQPVSVRYTMEGPECQDGDVWLPCPDLDAFPIDMIDMFVFLLLGYIAFTFYEQVAGIANDVAGSFIDLEIGSPIQEGINNVAQAPALAFGAAMRGESMASAVGLRPGFFEGNIFPTSNNRN